jgi:hypothetical protein
MRITVNGVEYDSVEAMPADVRRQYERAMNMLADRDKDGVPDMLEGSQLSVSGDERNLIISSVTTTRFEIDGKTVESLEDLPPDLREAFRSRSGLGLNVQWGDRLRRDPAKRKPRAIQALIVLALVLVVYWIVSMLKG